MRATGKIILSTASSDAALIVDGVAVPLRVLRPARAKAYRLAFDPRGGLRLSLPPRASLKRALGWAQGQEQWVRDQMDRRPAMTLLTDGAMVPVEGVSVRICWIAGAPRTVRLEGDRLLLGGPAESVGQRVRRWLAARAKAVLEAETLELAAAHGLGVTSVGVGDPRSRWGSCSSTGAIRYSWRLILAPPAVRRATVAHELAHLLHMDHSPAFHAAHARILGRDPKPAREWLRQNGGGLHRYGV